MSRSEIIDNIIAARKPIAERTTKKIHQLEAVQTALRACTDLLEHMAQNERLPEESRHRAAEHQKTITACVRDSLPNCIRDLGQLEKRFSRATLNIGVVGNARQGKSTFLQGFTGLTSEEIPAAATDHCTGAPSLIVHNPDGKTYADLEFFDEKDFFQEVIKPFYTRLNLSPDPISLRDFISSEIPQPKMELNATDKQLYEKLCDRRKDFSQYKSLLGSQPMKGIPREQIRGYIAQQDSDGKPIAQWVAVKMATIYCPFDVKDVGKITVCDTPGLGDFVCGAEENLMLSIANNLDAVVMLKRVPNGGIVKPEDTQLYDLLPKALPELEPKQWSHFVINRSGTSEELAMFQKQVGEKINTRRLIVLDARKRDEVLTEFDKILDDIKSNQAALDTTFYTKRFDAVQKQLASIASLAGSMLGLTPPPRGDDKNVQRAQQWFSLGENEGEDIWGSLKHALTCVVNQYRERGNTDHPKFTDALECLKKSLFLETTDEKTQEKKTIVAGLSTHEQFERDSANNPGSAYEGLCQKIRRETINSFDSLDDDLKRLFDQLRDEVKACFTREYFNAKGISHSQPQLSWWNSLAEDIACLGQTPVNQKNAQDIAKAIRKFDTATLSVRSFLLPRILSCFDALDTTSTKNEPYRSQAGQGIDEILNRIDSAAKNGIDRAFKQCKSFAKEPSVALLAAIEDLCDAVTITGGSGRAESIWADFYADHRSEIWPDTFKTQEDDRRFRKEWEETVRNLQEAVAVAQKE